ncbi:MAG: hypothetical protein WCI92_19450 [Bacteroidota bacterium]
MSQLIFSEKRLTAVVRKAVNEAFEAGQKPAALPHPACEYIHSIRELGVFLGCHYNTAKRIISQGRIRCTRDGVRVRFYIPDVLYAIDHDPVVSGFFTRLCDRLNNPAPQVTLPPRATVESELFPGRFVLATIRYQGWRCYACFPEETYGDADKVEDFVQEIIFRRHERHPFRIAPVISEQ